MGCGARVALGKGFERVEKQGWDGTNHRLIFIPFALGQVDARQAPIQPAGEPPVPVAQELHGGRDQHDADQGGVNEDRGGEGKSELLHFHQPGKGEGGKDHDHDGCRGRDDRCRALQALDDRVLVVA